MLVLIIDEVKSQAVRSPVDEEGKTSLSWSARSGTAFIQLRTEQKSIILEITSKAFHFVLVPVDRSGTMRTD